ncbi:DUF1648 domain-containing protein [Bacillus sp. LB(2018)]|nr:DUF1648 domain-containing protein [Bacillus cereus]RFB20046.1 DUF1648 domain-containing protein [Bacillus sp. LB(2018)]
MKKHVFPLLLIALTIIAWCIAWPYLPEEVPSHINVSGEVDRWTYVEDGHDDFGCFNYVIYICFSNLFT